MKDNGKVVWATLGEILKSFGCSYEEALYHSASLLKAKEVQQNTRSTMNKIS